MRNSRLLICPLVACLSISAVKAHDVTWLENNFGSAPSNPMALYYPGDVRDGGNIYVRPSSGEPCIVAVNLNPSTSTLVNAQVLPPSTANSVMILVQILRAPTNHTETATISGEWHATGDPAGKGCDAVNPNPFSVPITVSDQQPPLRISGFNSAWIMLNGPARPLQYSSCITGPWSTYSIGQTFNIRKMTAGFFLQTRKLGGMIAGTVTDDSGTPQQNLTLDLQYGGAKVFTDFTGSYAFPTLPKGLNWLSLSNPVGANLNVGISNADHVATNPFTAAMIKAVMVADPPVDPTNVCNCTPWCSIGFAALAAGNSPVYYAGGANNPSGGTPDCGTPVVTVTPPVGAPFAITAGTGHHHNSGPSPASGTWTVTAVVCGKTKSASVTVP
jgi:hypothetical protein